MDFREDLWANVDFWGFELKAGVVLLRKSSEENRGGSKGVGVGITVHSSVNDKEGFCD